MLAVVAAVLGALVGLFACALCAAAADADRASASLVPGSLSRRDFPDADRWLSDGAGPRPPSREARVIPFPATASPDDTLAWEDLQQDYWGLDPEVRA